MKRLIDGALLGTGFVAVVAVAFAIAYANDIFTVDKDGVPKFAVNDQGKITVGATESYVNLVIQNDGTTPNSKVNITADVLTVEGIRLESVNVSADIAASGAGGLDTGSETIPPASQTTWYYVWIITNNDGTLRDGLLSLSSTNPTMPVGYTKKRRVGAVGNRYVSPGVADFLQYVQEGNKCNYLSYKRLLTSGTATSYTSISANSLVPTTSTRIVLQVWVWDIKPVGTYLETYVRKTGTNEATGQIFVQGQSQNATVSTDLSLIGECNTNSNQQIDYRVNIAPTGGGYGALIDVLGYYDRI